MSISAVFLDKDGTLVKDVPHNVNIQQIKLAPYAMPSLKRLARGGFKFAIITNQSGIAMGLFSEKEIQKVAAYFKEIFQRNGLDLLGFYYCPHHPQGQVKFYTQSCLCRKPSAGLIEQAKQEHSIDLSSSWMIGDILDDVECGRRAGCRAILLDNGHETQWIKGPLREPHAVAKNFKEAADYILKVKSTYELEPV